MKTALEAYLETRDANQQRALGTLQQAGAIQSLMANAEKQKREQAYRQELSGAQTPEDRVAVAVKYGGPEAVLKVQQDALNRQAQREQTAMQYAQMLQQREDRLEETRRQFDARQAGAAEKAQFEQWFKTQQLQNQQMMANLNAQLRTMGMEIQKQGQQLQIERFDAAKRDKEEKEIEGQIGKTADRMKDVMPVWTAANQLNSLLAQYTPKDVPGVGYWKNTDIGKFFLGPEGKDVSSSIKLFGNSVLKAMSGAAVTAPEEVRQMAAQMADGRFKAEDFYIAWPKMAEWVNDQVKLGTSSLTPKARERFIDRTGIKIDPLKPRFTFSEGKLVDSQAATPTASPAAGLPRVASDADYEKLPSGAEFIGPDGKKRKKP